MKKIIVVLLTILLTSCGIQTPSKEVNDPTIRIKQEEVKYTLLDDAHLDEKDANDTAFNPINVMANDSSLKGKTFYWLGSSVTYGHESEGFSMCEYVSALSGAKCFKDAESGTTLLCDNANIKSGEKSYTSRLTNSEIFNKETKIDGFICQISTNDCTPGNNSKRGVISEDYENFDLKTTLGGVEYIISYVHKTWNCPIYFYSGAYFKDGKDQTKRESNNPPGSNYDSLVDDIKNIATKWNKIEGYQINIIDLYHDVDFNNTASESYYNWAMKDPIHPKKAGYLQWWSPYFVSALEAF